MDTLIPPEVNSTSGLHKTEYWVGHQPMVLGKSGAMYHLATASKTPKRGFRVKYATEQIAQLTDNHPWSVSGGKCHFYMVTKQLCQGLELQSMINLRACVIADSGEISVCWKSEGKWVRAEFNGSKYLACWKFCHWSRRLKWITVRGQVV